MSSINCESVLPAEINARIAAEQGSALGSERYIGAGGRVIGMETFGSLDHRHRVTRGPARR
jgi:transketolase